MEIVYKGEKHLTYLEKQLTYPVRSIRISTSTEKDADYRLGKIKFVSSADDYLVMSMSFAYVWHRMPLILPETIWMMFLSQIDKEFHKIHYPGSVNFSLRAKSLKVKNWAGHLSYEPTMLFKKEPCRIGVEGTNEEILKVCELLTVTLLNMGAGKTCWRTTKPAKSWAETSNGNNL